MFLALQDLVSGNMSEVRLLNVSLVRPAHEYFHHAVLEMTDGLMELGTTRWQLALALLGCWVIVFFVIMKGMKRILYPRRENLIFIVAYPLGNIRMAKE